MRSVDAAAGEGGFIDLDAVMRKRNLFTYSIAPVKKTLLHKRDSHGGGMGNGDRGHFGNLKTVLSLRLRGKAPQRDFCRFFSGELYWPTGSRQSLIARQVL
jgi:hypothetical protein